MNDINVYSVDDFLSLVYSTTEEQDQKKISKILYDYLKKDIIPKCQVLRAPLLDSENTGYVAGGFARWLMFGAKKIVDKDIIEHSVSKIIPNTEAGNLFQTFSFTRKEAIKSQQELAKHLFYHYLTKLHGDIDIFFENKKEIKAIKKNTLSSSQETKFAETWELRTKEIKNFLCYCANDYQTIKVQYVFFQCGKVEKILNIFDINNARIAIDFRNDKVYAYKNLVELENLNALSIYQEYTPKVDLVDRVYKYAVKYKYSSICREDTSLHFFAKWCHDNMKNIEESSLRHERHQEKLSQIMQHTSLISLFDLPLFMGVLKVNVPSAKPSLSYASDFYGYDTVVYVDVDGAVDAMQERNAGNTKELPTKLKDYDGGWI